MTPSPNSKSASVQSLTSQGSELKTTNKITHDDRSFSAILIFPDSSLREVIRDFLMP